MRISDWSSDVCSSYLNDCAHACARADIHDTTARRTFRTLKLLGDQFGKAITIGTEEYRIFRGRLKGGVQEHTVAKPRYASHTAQKLLPFNHSCPTKEDYGVIVAGAVRKWKVPARTILMATRSVTGRPGEAPGMGC